MIKRLVIFFLVVFSPLLMAKGIYQQPESFVKEMLGLPQAESKVIWLGKEMQQKITRVLGHKYPRLRLRYWQKETESVWILEEIGKEEPITVGIHVIAGEIRRLKVLIYRETRGDEVRHQFFTQQFDQAKLTSENKLDRSIDGITGATLSVRALRKLSMVALLLASEISEKG